MHGIMAAAVRVPELALSDEEGKALAAAVAEVSRHYPMTIDPKTLAWFNLAGCAATIYGPRIYLARARISEEKRQKKAAPSGDNITAFPGGGIGPVGTAVQ